MAELVVRDLKLRLGDNDILKGVSLVVRRGEVVALLGPSGSGKTTLLRAVAGLEQPYAGSVAIGDTVFFDAARKIDVPAEKRGLGLVFQSYALWPHRSVSDNVAYGLKLRTVAGNEIRQRVGRALALYPAPKSLCAAECMGSNNRLPGKLKEKFGERAALMVEGIRLDGMLRCATTIGGDAIGVIRLERVRIADGPGPNRIPMTLQTQMYLGERWELVFSRGALSGRVHAPAPLPAGQHQVALPP